MMKFFTFLVISFLTTLTRGLMLNDWLPDEWQCPDPEEFVMENPEYTLECVDNSIPPWPICLFHNVTTFVEVAVNSAGRCCDFENLDDCKCPYKDRQWWRDRMTGWCESISTCPQISATDASISSLMGTEYWAMFLEEELDKMEGMEDMDMEDMGENGDDYYND